MEKHIQEVPKKDRILSAAEQVFSRKGYVNATVDEIIKIADTGKGTVYKYYKNKDYLFYTLILSKHVELMDNIEKNCQESLPFDKRLQGFLSALIHFIMHNRVLWQVLMFETMAGTAGWGLVWNQETNDYDVDVRWGAPPTKAEITVKKKYCLLLGEEVRKMEDIFRKGVEDGVLKPTREAHLVAMNMFFGTTIMLSQKKEQNLPVEEIVSIISDRFINGNKK